MKKLILLLFLCIFAFTAAGFCGDGGIGEDQSGHHCLICCGAGHYSYVHASATTVSPLLAASPAVIAQDTIHQNLFVSGIDRPPAVSL
jgi:hypothetical protein